jgi:phospholipid/cholesterol/gamma-HCH transport system substrate-binding protein
MTSGMSPRVSYIVVGLFVVVGALMGVVLSFWIGEGRFERDLRPVVMVFEDSVSGLSTGSRVSFLGVEVGSVESLDLVTLAGSPMVRVRARVLETAPLGPDIRASLAIEGITGVSYVHLEPAPGRPARYYELETDATQIPTVPGDLRAAMERLPRLADAAQETLKRAQGLLSEQNVARVAETLTALESVAAAVADHRGSLARTLETTADAVAELRTAASAVTATATEARPGLLRGVERFAAAADDAAAVTAELQSWLEANRPALEAFATGGLGRSAAVMADLEEVLEQLDALVRELREDPSEVLYRREEDAIVLEP